MPDGIEIDSAATIELLGRLVRIPSHPGVPRQEEGVALALADWLKARGVDCRLEEAAPGRPNLIATLSAAAPGPHLLLCGHTDTVPLNEEDPGPGFSAEIRGGRMYGRGTADMKGGLAAMAGALAALARSGALKAGKLSLAAVADEEERSLGAEALLRGGFRADGAVVGEPTRNALCLGHKGLEWLVIDFTGRAAHGGTPEAGLNAISAAARFIALAEAELAPRLRAKRHPLLGCPSLNFGTIHGGDQPSTVAARCRLSLDRRTVPGENYAGVCAELRELLGRTESLLPGLGTRLTRAPEGMATMEHRALATDPGHPLARTARAALRKITGREEPDAAFPAWTDAALLREFGGIPSIVLGPGDLSVAHSPRECVELEEVVAAARFYARCALDFCSGPAAP